MSEPAEIPPRCWSMRVRFDTPVPEGRSAVGLDAGTLPRESVSQSGSPSEPSPELRRMTALFDHALNGILLTDDHELVVDANPAACCMLGYTRAELCGLQRTALTVRAASHALVEEAWLGFLRDGQRRGETGLRRKDGSTVIVEFASAANVVPGLHMHVLVDATARLAAEQQLRRLLAQQQADFEAMRDELMRDVHDELGQVLGAVMFEADTLATRHGAELDHLRAAIQDAVTVTRNLSRTLAEPFAECGLPEALQQLAHTVSRRSEIDVSLDCALPRLPLPECLVRGTYRVAQEALNNAVKHAGAKRARLQLGLHESASGGRQIELEVTDDGAGFDTQAPVHGGSGLRGMRQRAELLRGQLQVHSRPGQGTRVCLQVPLEAAVATPMARWRDR